MSRIFIFMILAIGVIGTDVSDKEVEEMIRQIFGDCDTETGHIGLCVRPDMCHQNGVITDGSNKNTERRPPYKNMRKCKKDFDVCCRVPTVKEDKSEQGCGYRNQNGLEMTNSIGEGTAKPGEFPWTVALTSTKQNGNGSLNLYIGSGSLIHPSIVLTGASKVQHEVIMVRAGEWDTRSTSELYSHQDREVKEIVVHENFGPENLFNNVALLFLSEPVELTPNVRTVCLPKQDDIAGDGSRCFSSGWGLDILTKKRHTIMSKVELPVVDKVDCQDQLRKTRLSTYFQLHNSFMCAGGEADRDTCAGDGGSPLVCPIENQPGRYKQSGIVSWGIGCGKDRIPGVYTNVASFRTWIEDKITERGYNISAFDY